MSTTQTIGMASVVAADSIPEPPNYWRLLSHLAPFQMFMSERAKLQGSVPNMLEWTLASASEAALEIGDQALLLEYSMWHRCKGYWPTETPFGQFL